MIVAIKNMAVTSIRGTQQHLTDHVWVILKVGVDCANILMIVSVSASVG